MDLQPSGNKQVELVSIETEKLYFTIKGKYQQTDFIYPEDIYQDSFFCHCTPNSDLIDINVYSNNILFYEYQDYQIIIECKGSYKLDFFHESKLIRDQIAFTTKSQRVMAGSINFRGDIGLTEFIVLLDGKEYLVVRVEVFPSKVDYRKDYINIIADINEEIHNLAFEFLKRTYLNITINHKEGNSLTEFYSILNFIYKQLIRSINIITHQPHHILTKEVQIVDYHKIKHTSSETIKWLEKNPSHLIRRNNKYIPIKLLEVKKNTSVDTYENQFLKHMLRSIINRLCDLKLKYNLLDRVDDDLLIGKIDNMVKELNSYLKGTFLNKVSEYKPMSHSLFFGHRFVSVALN